ncbi:hypothetical protein A2230_02345 [candidate division WOR-1 bacterium RIFOXYA2_FULL_36_21]|uniref:tetrahydrofolate synthase n=1 Tax=candidate division WOR-1 bacterium RIFOXYB2_FULL_36_35 TaxID=1802578 RepID=A0A1F4S5Y1_UNCSA|nr:MAG: hypothetical protein A2230_02345 [candidate division WOR-1 bacterium RIFOXYA2_FULL_36_21]OGC15809.1 MAG: hypothetical protein A2290_05680 [candidate division WOR-1 bacterium RIFOXYB2_FULL_36_35]OGC15929.1 MAG: hypothetical protein A2282_05030 [candidate division WOR-1 bacterium RIFOXYA12_FULL_36_13]
MLDFDTTNINLGLERVSVALEELGNPHLKFPAIHVAGTNGKGSVCAMTASILKETGYKIGLFTSPHLLKWNERIKVDGVDISDEDFERLEATIVRDIRGVRGQDSEPLLQSISQHLPSIHQLTPFEVITCMAFQYFAEQKVDIAVIEVGMGGRLDATNVVKSIVTVITNIDFDHTRYLGDTIQKIAYEKSGIIKSGIPVVTAEQKTEALKVFRKVAVENLSPLHVVEPQSHEGKHIFEEEKYFLKLNLPIILKVIDLLRDKKYLISDENLKEGITKTKWPARFQIISRNPLTIVDGAHNPAGMKILKEFLLSLGMREKFTIVFGSQEDKDSNSMIDILSEISDSIIEAQSSHPKAKKAPFTVKEAIQTAKAKGKPILITGSLFIAAEALIV